MSSTRLSSKLSIRLIDPSAPVERQIEALRELARNPPEGSCCITFDPKLAAAILEASFGFITRNRPIRSSKIIRYSSEMAAKNWLPNGESIKFGQSGKLLDGYHRLTACIKSQSRFTTDVRFGVPDYTYRTMDTGAIRGGSDVLAIAGFTRSSVRASATRWHMILTSGHPNDRNIVTPSNEDIIKEHKLLNSDLYFIEAMRNADSLYRKSKLFPLGSMTAMLFIYGKENPKGVNEFVADAVSNKGDAEKLYKQLRAIADMNLGRVHENTRNARVILTLNAYYTGVKLPRGARSPDWDSETPFPTFDFGKAR
jgi:hypothetical protein